MHHRIIQGDVMAGLRMLPDACVQCTVTSPPYYNLRNYGVEGQIGLEETPEQFIQKMVEVFREVRRVTRDDGVLWLNFGDSYAGSGCGWQKEGGSSIKREWVEDYNGRPPGYISSKQESGLKPKDLMEIPSEVARALRKDGWHLRSRIPWIKRNCMPESTTDRPTSAIEYIFLMAKSPKYFYDGEAIRVPSSDSYLNDARPQGVLRQKVNKRSKYPDEGQFKKQDQTGNPTYTGFNERWKGKHSTTEEQAGGNRVLKCVKAAREETGSHDHPFGDTRNYRNSDPFFESWQGLYSENENPLAFIINPQSRAELHFATFPDLLAATCIKVGTSEYGCCPKCGKPWERVIDKIPSTMNIRIRDNAKGIIDQKSGLGTRYKASEEEISKYSYKKTAKCIGESAGSSTTNGWKPGCKCGEKERIPCVVLDPFMGSGTVAVVARELNRSSVGCEINPEYVKIIRERLQVDQQLDTGLIKYLFEKVE